MKIRSDIDFAGAARAVNLLDPVAAQDAATKAYADGLGGWQDLAVVAPGAVNAVDFAPIDQSYGDLRLVVEGASHDSGSDRQLTIAVSNGTTFSAGATATGTFPASAALYGAFSIDGYRADCGAMPGATAALPASPTVSTGASLNPVWRCAGGIRGLRVGITGGAAFDGGTLRLQARR